MKSMLNKKHKVKLLKLHATPHDIHLPRWQIGLFVGVFGLLGAYLLLFSKAATNTLLYEDFSTGSANLSPVTGGTWTATGGVYQLSSPSTASSTNNSNLSIHNTAVPVGDFTLTTDAKAAATSKAYDDFSIIFGFIDANNYYYAHFTEKNEAATNGMFRVVNGSVSQVKDFTATTSAGSSFHSVKIEKIGTTINVYRGTSLLGSFTDANAGAGKVGFGTYNNAASFDNLKVTVPIPASGGGASTTVTLGPVSDSYVLDGSSTNYGASTSVRIEGSTKAKGYLKFDLSSLAGKAITSAKLKVYVGNQSASDKIIKEIGDNSWVEGTINGTNEPTSGANILTFKASTTGAKELDITPYFVNKAGQQVSIAIEGAAATDSDGLEFSSKENSSNKPQLVVTTDGDGGENPPPLSICSDSVDNDGDAKVDYPADPGCTSATDTDETDIVSPPPPPPSTTYTCDKTLSVGGDVASFVNSLSTGQTGCLKGGTHSANGVDIRKSGITVASVPGERATAVLADTEWSIKDDINSVTIKRINFTGSTDEIFKIHGDNLTFEDNEFTNNKYTIPGACILMGGGAGVVKNVVINRNIFKDCGDPAGSADHRNHAIYGSNFDGATITNNLFYGAGSYRISMYGTLQRNATITHNILDGAGSQRGGIVSNGTTSSGHVIERNIIVNTVNEPAVSVKNGGNASIVNNNCFYKNGGGTIVIGSGSSIGQQIGNITTDPLFVNAGVRDYHLKPGPCFDLVGYDIYSKILANR